jgi:hypothetical protein
MQAIELFNLREEKGVEAVLLQIAPICQEYQPEGVYASLVLAMAILESGNFDSDLFLEVNNMFGHKGKDWTGQTKEQVGNNLIDMKGSFKAFPDVEASIRKCMRLLCATRYTRVREAISWIRACTAIQKCGYASSRRYSLSLKRIIRQYRLYRFDTFIIPPYERKYSIFRTLKIGSGGWRVRELQTMLIKLEYDLGKWAADGSYGRKTASAIEDFQDGHGLVVDGVAGINTIEVIEELFQ